MTNKQTQKHAIATAFPIEVATAGAKLHHRLGVNQTQVDDAFGLSIARLSSASVGNHTSMDAWRRSIAAPIRAARLANGLSTAIDNGRQHPAKGQPVERCEFDEWKTDLMTLLSKFGVHSVARSKVEVALEHTFQLLEKHNRAFSRDFPVTIAKLLNPLN